jgi:SAM-dependent methyltransferase
MRDAALPSSGYANRLLETLYAVGSPLFDVFLGLVMLPLGGDRKVRADIARWLGAADGHAVLSLCCGTGRTDRAILAVAPRARVTGIDLGPGQLARARRKDPAGRIDYRQANAADTGLPGASFDRVVLVGALHEMPRDLRRAVLAEARRLCRPDGRFLAVEPGHTRTRWSAFGRAAVLFWWVPGNPETAATYDLIEHGLDTELREAGFEVLERHTTSPDWFEGLLAR